MFLYKNISVLKGLMLVLAHDIQFLLAGGWHLCFEDFHDKHVFISLSFLVCIYMHGLKKNLTFHLY